LVSREILSPQGATFTSRRAEDEKQSEFLASEDNWFRPSMCRTGPDGALWVADIVSICDRTSEMDSPRCSSQARHAGGDDKGRIYRIYPQASSRGRLRGWTSWIRQAWLRHWIRRMVPQRDLVQQMLLWRDDKAAIEPLKKLVCQLESAGRRGCRPYAHWTG